MAAYINDGWPGGEALGRASERLAHIWIIRDGASSSSWEGQEERGQKRARQDKGGKGQGKPGSKGQKAGQGKNSASSDALEGVQRVSIHKGVKYSGAFNGKKGCTWNEKDCPQYAKHMCSVMMPNGQVCRRTNHGAHGHR